MDWLKKLKKPNPEWRKRKLCFFYDQKNEIVQEWIAAELQDSYVICETMSLQTCYEVPKDLIAQFMKEKRLDDTELSCA